MSLTQRVEDAFSPAGVLSRMVDRFQPRSGQEAMALAVARVIEEGGELVVEAGTGVGKTFAYLVPALLSGERVLLSTATKTLQDQLYGRDLPRLAEAMSVPLRIAMLKGRGSYLCLHRLGSARAGLGCSEAAELAELAQVEVWASATRSGDLGELSGLDDRSRVIPLVTSTRENCLGSSCPEFRACHVNLARREALAADVVIVNHHLFFADLRVRESGMAELLPTVHVVVFDEAHQLNETGVQFLGVQLGTGQMLDFARDLVAAGLQHARGLCDWRELATRIERATRSLRLAIGQRVVGSRLRWTGPAPEGLAVDEWRNWLGATAQAAADAMAALDMVSELSPDLDRLHGRARELTALARQFSRPGNPEAVRWVDVGLQLRLVESPLDIADAVRTLLLDPCPPGERRRSWIFTSATLGDDERLSWFTERCGLPMAKLLRVGSPFDYARQSALYIPRHLPRPQDASHSAAVADFVAAAALKLGGRTLVLTTSLKALRAIGERLQTQLGAAGPIHVLVQGQGPKSRLIERFRAGGQERKRGCVLVGSASFWEGVDVPGEALQLVVIDKLPFPSPGDPLVEARSSRLESLGRSAFNEHALPEAAVALKQGAGRLIRSESDRGVLVVCDTRLVSMGYGRRLLRALPPMRRLSDEADYEDALDSLTRTSTTDPCLT